MMSRCPLLSLPGPLLSLPGPLLSLPGPLLSLPGPLLSLPGPLLSLPGPLVGPLLSRFSRSLHCLAPHPCGSACVAMLP